MFEEKYNNLTGAEKENFKRITSLLLNRTFMVNRFYDKNQGTFRSNSDYRFIDRNIDLFREYLEIAGYRLLKDSNYEVIYIENEYEYNKKRLDKNTTIFLYGLRLKFDEDRESVKLNTDTIVSVSDIIKTLIDVGAFNKKPSDMDIKTALSNLAKFNIIQKVDGKFEDPETKIIIFPSILFAVTNEKITALSQTISILEENVEDDENEEDEETPPEVIAETGKEELKEIGYEDPTDEQGTAFINNSINFVYADKGERSPAFDYKPVLKTTVITINTSHKFYTSFLSKIYSNAEVKTTFELFLASLIQSVRKTDPYQAVQNDRLMTTWYNRLNNYIAEQLNPRDMK